MKKYCSNYLMIGIFLTMLLPLWGCRSVSVEYETGAVIGEKPGPPPHAPAHGYRRKAYSYIYYPECRIYFDVSQHLYFYFDLGAWRKVSVLPVHISLVKEGSVSIQMDIDTPYIKIHEHEKRYPPKKFKKSKGPGPGKAKGKSKWK